MCGIAFIYVIYNLQHARMVYLKRIIYTIVWLELLLCGIPSLTGYHHVLVSTQFT